MLYNRNEDPSYPFLFVAMFPLLFHLCIKKTNCENSRFKKRKKNSKVLQKSLRKVEKFLYQQRLNENTSTGTDFIRKATPPVPNVSLSGGSALPELPLPLSALPLPSTQWKLHRLPNWSQKPKPLPALWTQWELLWSKPASHHPRYNQLLHCVRFNPVSKFSSSICICPTLSSMNLFS